MYTKRIQRNYIYKRIKPTHDFHNNNNMQAIDGGGDATAGCYCL